MCPTGGTELQQQRLDFLREQFEQQSFFFFLIGKGREEQVVIEWKD